MIRDIIQGQKEDFEKKQTEAYVQRQSVIRSFESGLIQVVIGPRRAGKSIFSIHAIPEQYRIGYVNFDDEHLVEVKNFDEIMEAVNSAYINPDVFLFDEIQNMPKWELIVNRLHRQGTRLVLTGSNSNLLSKELATHLTGRHLLTHIFPFSLGEIFSIGDKKLNEAAKKLRCSDYVSHGGFPEPWVKSLNFRDYLQVLFDSVLFKDIIRRYRIRQPEALGRLAGVLLAGITSPVSMQSLTRSTGIGSLPTLQKYFGYLVESFLFFPVARFSWKVREQVRSNRKIYCYDNGYYEAKAFRFSPDWGRLYENTVAVELKRRTLYGDQQMFYWMNVEGEEVDFVIQEGLVIRDLIQVCYQPDASATKSREVRALLKASADLKCGKLTIVTGDYEAVESFTWFGFSGNISFVPLWKWLVE
jgi:uncharacterized protein